MKAQTDYPVHDLIANRWSPYSFAARSVNDNDLRSIFEAAHWAPSSFNEQPWRYIIAKKENQAAFNKLLSCLTERNRLWASHAPVLVLAITSLKLARNNKSNRAATHDLGLASANLSLEATARGLSVHQMIGIEPDKARQCYEVPADFEIFTAIAIGYAAKPADRLTEFADRDQTRRPRKPLNEILFENRWEEPSPLVL